MNKKGAGNIEFILAFLLFISFTAATIYFFNPVKSKTSLESSVDYVFNEIVRNASVEIDSYSIVIREMNINNINITISGIASNKKVLAFDYDGNSMRAERNGDVVCIEKNNKNFSTLYFSEDINEKPVQSDCLLTTNYKISSSLTSDILSERRIRDLSSLYSSNYNQLKEQFNIPANLEFSFSFVFPNELDKIEGGRKAPLRAEVFSTSKAKEILRENGDVQFGSLTVSVW